MFRNIGLALLAMFGFVVAPTQAQSWAEKMFKSLDHDFGVVARGADTVYKFEITNIYKQDMTVTGVRSSCGCTSPSLEGPNGPVPEGGSVTLKSHEKAYVVARFNTRTHVGQKGATLTVTLGPPYSAEVQLHVHGLIRGDVVFNPGAVEFGEVNEGQPAEQRLTVSYAGRPDWEIVDVTNDNDNFEVELNETERSNGRVSYDLVIRLKGGMPAGYVKDQLTVVTNDSRSQNQRIPLFVAGHVRPEFSVTPSQLVLGELKPGQTVTRKIIVRGREPFKILDVTCGENCFVFKKDDELKAVHFVEVTFTAGEQPGRLQTPIHIVTDRNNREATCLASAKVVAPAETPASAEPAQAAVKQDGAVVQTVAAQ
ncbi:MAG: DUF1573 domain-containing protein [Pirellulales bacterium]|nr:DUF1573 domain-containing protein [Pirellulales bacterium]